MSVDAHHNSGESAPIRCAVVTCSDTRTPETDTSGRLIVDLLGAAGHPVAEHRLISDDPDALSTALDELVAVVDAVLITGGTGLAARDNAPDVLGARFERVLPGFGELFRMLSWQEIGSASMLSRAVAGVERSTFIVSMPGSTAAVRLAMEQLVLPELGHVVGLLRR